MKANRMWLFSDVLEKNKRVFKVPVYQRNYDWTNIQCEKLFQDIMKAGENNRQHFTGTVVYIDDVNGGSGLNEVLIIDGQQRITTMYILLKALYDASKGVSARIEDEVQEVMFNRHCDEKYKVKLKPVKTDNEQLMLLIKDKVDKMAILSTLSFIRSINCSLSVFTGFNFTLYFSSQCRLNITS